ncbi:murein hydrolase activator EnvC family protein [Dyella telluris]|uniref:Peptidoglycan DD-metalloendopeptidase family protein n=1 Tax=Dyella telluris TaxID=2763498 RepID=A0A7G8Q8C2_9GAMM|nr:peptidoglycan DD-metalloendopeptidase family protein [Dyella telluris]QNK03030.1 peptidoglycan DD-metalloendopeptidase family protein [Dyella telluris]
MPIPLRRARPLACAAISALALVVAAQPAWALQDSKTKAEQAEAQKKLSDVRSKMEALAKEQADTAAKRDSATTELAKQANAVASAARAVRETDTQLAAKQKQLADLQDERTELQKNLEGQRAAIAELLRATYALGQGSDLRLLMGDDDIARIAQALAYSKYFQEDRVARVQKLMGDLARLQDLETQITAEQQALQTVRAQRETQSKALEQQRAAQARLVADADAQYKDQGSRLAALKQNEASLNSLVATLQKAIDEAAREAERAAKASEGKAAPPAGKGLANIRGSLPWPAPGVVNTYGNGVLIKAPGGSEVKAVSSGRVVYAAFLRGYGMLVIVSHGGGWMSMYGNNETILHGVGDQVSAGEAVGTASAPTGTNTGVYFELRQNNQPVDPRTWLSRKG